jgi:hypothetical protein
LCESLDGQFVDTLFAANPEDYSFAESLTRIDATDNQFGRL